MRDSQEPRDPLLQRRSTIVVVVSAARRKQFTLKAANSITGQNVLRVMTFSRLARCRISDGGTARGIASPDDSRLFLGRGIVIVATSLQRLCYKLSRSPRTKPSAALRNCHVGKLPIPIRVFLPRSFLAACSASLAVIRLLLLRQPSYFRKSFIASPILNPGHVHKDDGNGVSAVINCRAPRTNDGNHR